MASLRTLRFPPSLLRESRALQHLIENDERCEDADGYVDVFAHGPHTTQEKLDHALHLLSGGSSEDLTEDQWLGVAEIANWLDMEQLHKAVITHYKSWFRKDRDWLRRWHRGVPRLCEKFNVSLARRLVHEDIRDFTHAHELSQLEEEQWSSVRGFGGSWIVKAVAVLSDGRVAIAVHNNMVQLFDLSSGTSTRAFCVDEVVCITALPHGRMAAGREDGLIQVWDTKAVVCTTRLSDHTDKVCAMVVLPDGRLASASRDRTIKLWNLVDKVCTATLAGHRKTVFALAVLPDGRLASGSQDKSIKLWNTDTNKCTSTLMGHGNSVLCLAVLPDGRIVSGSADKSIKIWDVDTGVCTATLNGHLHSVNALAVLPDGRLASGCFKGQIKLWSTTSNTCVMDLNSQVISVWSLTVLPDGRLASGGLGSTTVKIWNTLSGVIGDVLRGGRPNAIEGISVLTDGRVATCSRDNFVWVLSLVSKTYAVLDCDANVKSVAAVPDGRVAAGCEDCHVRLWSVDANSFTLLTGHTGSVDCIVPIPGDPVLASGSVDGTVRLWNFETHLCIRVLQVSRPVIDMVVLPDGHLIAASYNAIRLEGAKHVWSTASYDDPQVDRISILEYPLVLPQPSSTDDLCTWTEQFHAVHEHNQRTWLRGRGWNSCIEGCGFLPDGSSFEFLKSGTVRFKNGQVISDLYASCCQVMQDGSIVLGCGVFQNISARANLFLALTAAGVPEVYILHVLSNCI